MFNKIKAGAQEAAITAGIETEYLKGKKSGFHHPPDVEAQIQVMREQREEIPLLREDMSAILNHEKDLADSETKTGSDFVSMAEHASQHPQLKTIFQLFGGLKTTIGSNRYNYHATVEQIKEEWKVMENNDLKDIRVKQDQVNRAWSTKKYWDKEKKGAKGAECDSKYKILVSELVHMVHDLREKKEDLLPGYLLSIVQAEMEFHRKSLEELVKCENTLRGMGKVVPIKFAGYDQFAAIGALTESTTAGGGEDPPPTPSRNAGPPSARGVRAKGLFAFQGQSADELSFQPGDILNVVSQEGDWWTAEMNGKTGLIPGNYVQII